LQKWTGGGIHRNSPLGEGYKSRLSYKSIFIWHTKNKRILIKKDNMKKENNKVSFSSYKIIDDSTEYTKQ
jgi:hypothetical protein